MAKVSHAKAGKGAVVITLLSNPAIRRVVIRGAGKAATSAAGFMAGRSKSSPEIENDHTPAPPTPTGNPLPNSSSIAESAAVESIVASVAKPLADRLAVTTTGRSALQTIHSISATALGKDYPRRQAGATMANFVGGILTENASPKTKSDTQPAPVKFTPIKPSGSTPPPPVTTMQWPPPATGNTSP